MTRRPSKTDRRGRERYAAAAQQAASGWVSHLLRRRLRLPVRPDHSDLYGEEMPGLPAEAIAASLGCGNPTALAELEPGQTVLDLGSGGGIDVLLSAKRVGPEGKAYGLDMTDEMLELARANQARAGVDQRRVPEGANRGHSPAGLPAWTSSSPTASSISRETRNAWSARPSGCWRRAAGSRCPISCFAAPCRRPSARTWNCGRAVSPGRWRSRRFAHSS